MEKAKILGRRIKYFRNRAGISQLDLETSIDAAYGSISRVENGSVNPSKETLDKIVTALNLEGREVEYVAGSRFYPSTPKEISIAINEVDEYFNKPDVFAYMVDDRYRLVSVSQSFIELLNLPSRNVEFLGNTLIELALDKKWPIRRLIEGEHYEELLSNLLKRFYKECAFMIDDEYVQQSFKAIENDQLGYKIWTQVSALPPKFSTPKGRNVYFKIGGQEVPMNYSLEPLFKYPRFEIVDYTSAE